MKSNDLSYKLAVVLNVAVFLALIRTVSEPLFNSVDAADLRVLMASCLFMAISCLAMTIMTFLSKTRVNAIIAILTIVVLVITKITLLH